MKSPLFTIPFSDSKTIITKEESLPHFYPHLHRHNETQLTWVIEGEGTLVTDSTMRAFQSNEIYWISANQSHVFKSDPVYFERDSKKRIYHLDIYFNVDSQLAPFFSIPEVRSLKNFIAKNNTGFVIPNEDLHEVSRIMLLVHNTNGFEQFFQFISLLKKIVSLDEKIEPLSANRECSSYSDNEGMRIATIYNFIMQNYNQPITLDEVSKLVFMTPQAFCRYFKKRTQHTLISFVNQVRINEACKRLVDKKCESIAAVAYLTGFNNITNFNRVFKNITHKSPKEYIESYQCHTKSFADIA